MKRNIVAILSIVAVTAGVAWKLAGHPQTSAGLQDIRLVPGSEHSYAGSTKALAGIRIRLSGGDFDDQIRTTSHEVPQISVAVE